MERSIVEIAKIAKTTSRTLRHYDEVGLLAPTRIGSNGYRYYDDDALVRLQRILLLRQLGLGIPSIADVLAGQTDDSQALETHLALLAQEKERLDRQMASVEITLKKIRERKPLMAEDMFDGFDHTQYRQEVAATWGADAYARSDAWWRAKSPAQQRDYRAEHASIAADYRLAQDAGEAPERELVQSIVARHVVWLREAAEASGSPVTAGRLRGYGDMYVADPRFAENYGGQRGAQFVRAAITRYAETALPPRSTV